MNPDELLAVARLLAAYDAPTPPSDAQIRRAISTAYYAVFHAALIAAAERFLGSDSLQSAAYRLLYRGFDHGRMKAICESIGRTTLSANYQTALGRTHVHPELAYFSRQFVALQQLRHLADYDPRSVIVHMDAIDTVGFAEKAVAALSRAPPQERADLLALLLVDVRS